MTQIILDRAPTSGVSSAQMWSTVVLWVARSRSRRALAQLDDSQLRDIGLNRSTAISEANRMFWQG